MEEFPPPIHKFYSEWKLKLYDEKNRHWKKVWLWDTYNIWEEKTGRPREEIYYIIAFFSTLYLSICYFFAFDFAYSFYFCNFFIGFLYPAYWTIYYLDFDHKVT